MTQTTQRTRGLRYLTLAIVALLVVAPATVAAVPSPPHEVFGTVTDQDGDAVDGASVTVTDANGNSHAATTNADGYYEIKFPADEGDAGETLTVEVSGESETTSFASGSSERLDFEVTTSSDDERDDDDGSSSGGSSSSGGYSSGGSSSADDSSDSAGDSDDGAETPVNPVKTTEKPSSPEPTTAESTTEESVTERQTTEESITEDRTTSTGIPGFGVVVAVLALIAVALIAVRRE